MNEIQEISVDELKSKIEADETVYIIDVREDFEVANGMIPGAVHIPMNTIPENMDVFSKDISYIIVCAGGVRSENVCQYLVANGIQAVNMTGGMYSWSGDLQ